ncbi:MAG: DNA-directed RNA polymerase subunit beta, partial [Clostridia bacterium]|nr:DNA-directed RNA polymerase subunit beta [Clostridia bacterium]
MRMTPQKLGTNVRMSFSRIKEVLEMPNLIEVQRKSYDWFLNEGLREVLEDVSPIVDYSGKLLIDFVDYTIEDNPKYPMEECKERDVNYAVPLRVKVRLTNKETDEIKEQEIYMGDFPKMTDNGTFVINGAERVIVSQIVRSPGVYFAKNIDKMGKLTLSGTVIPYRGAWLEYETDINDVFYVKIDRNRKIPVTILLRALGLSEDEDIRALFGDDNKIIQSIEKDGITELARTNHTTPYEEALKEIYRRLRPGDPPLVESAEILLNNMFFDPRRYDISAVGRYKFNKKLSFAKRIEGYELALDAVSAL